MEFRVTFDDPQLLAQASGRCLTGAMPHLRFVSLMPAELVQPVLSTLAPHIAARVMLDPGPEVFRAGLHAMLTADVTAARERFSSLDPRTVVTWAELAPIYERWRVGQRAALRSILGPYAVNDLDPIGFEHPAVSIELLGTCQAQAIAEVVPGLDPRCVGPVRVQHTVQVMPIPTPPPESFDATIFFPPLRLLGDRVLDDYTLASPDEQERRASRAVEALHAYLESAVAPRPSWPVFIAGLIVPVVHPEGHLVHELANTNVRYLVRQLNAEIMAFCAARSGTVYVDLDALASSVGKNELIEDVVGWSTHGGIACPTANITGLASSGVFYAELIGLVSRQLLTISGVAQVKAVIVDLDNTVFNGIATDLELGSWRGRFEGLVEALLLLKRRGIFLAIASKNDETFIREHWDRLLSDYAPEPLRIPLRLEDFDVVKIDFRPKSVTVGEILAELNIGEDAAVFVDDNPFEREEVQSAFPGLRVLGAELDRVRQELLFSPFTDRHVRLAEDRVRSATAATQAALKREIAAGGSESFLASLGLRCTISRCESVSGVSGQRAVQLVNKTNQWNLNGARTTDAELSKALASGAQCLVADVEDRANAYGIVAAVVVDVPARTVTHMVVSCRVIGMGIDDVIASWLEDELGELFYAFAPTGRNKAVEAWIDRHGGSRGDGARGDGAPGDGAPGDRARCGGLVELSHVSAPSHVELSLALEGGIIDGCSLSGSVLAAH